MRVLIAEDERAIAELIMMNLRRAGYDCDWAADGQAAADQIERRAYDLILLDIMLPKVDGYALMEYIAPQGIPTIFITAKDSVNDKVKGLLMGADDYIVKPFSIDEMIARIQSVLRRYHKNIALYRDTLYEKVWDEEYGQTRTLDLHIQRLRKKLGWDEVIKTVYKVGYMLEVDDEVCR